MSQRGWTFQFSKNGLDWVRHWAALCVMLLHYTGYALSAGQAEGLLGGIRQVVSFFPGVVVLFALSGYLVSASMERCHSAKEFLMRRVLRLYPELWVCTLVNLGVVCTLAWQQLDAGMLKWVLTQIVGIANTPECLKDFATGSINGALWTIFVMIQLYVVYCAAARWLKKLDARQWILCIVVAGIVNVLCGQLNERLGTTLSKLLERTFVPYVLWFLIGAFCYRERERLIPILRRGMLPMLLVYLAAWLWLDISAGYYANIVVGVLCPLIAVGAGYCLPALRFRIDLSYGMFLYHWIVLNVLVHFDGLRQWPWPVSLLTYIAATLALAWASSRGVGGLTKRLRGSMRQ